MRHLITILALVALSAACDAAPSAAAPSAAAPSVAATQLDRGKITRALTPPAVPRSSCLGAVVYTVAGNASGPPWRPVCITVGGIIRLENLGPGYLSVDPQSKVDCAYEGGVHECRLLYTGTVKFTVTNSSGVRLLTVNVAAAISPPRPSPACTQSGTFIIDATYGGPGWIAACVKLGTIMRVINLGPEGFSVSPANAVSCWYEAGVRECRFIKAATVIVTITVPGWEAQEFIVVAIK